MSDLVKLVEAIRGAGDKVEKGYFSSAFFANKWDKSESHTRNILRDAVKKNLVDVKIFKVDTGRRLLPIPHYKIK